MLWGIYCTSPLRRWFQKQSESSLWCSRIFVELVFAPLHHQTDKPQSEWAGRRRSATPTTFYTKRWDNTLGFPAVLEGMWTWTAKMKLHKKKCHVCGRNWRTKVRQNNTKLHSQLVGLSRTFGLRLSAEASSVPGWDCYVFTICRVKVVFMFLPDFLVVFKCFVL